jgi:hypothetical protein
VLLLQREKVVPAPDASAQVAIQLCVVEMAAFGRLVLRRGCLSALPSLPLQSYPPPEEIITINLAGKNQVLGWWRHESQTK